MCIKDSDIVSKVIMEYFAFLVTDHGFKKNPEYQYAREIHNEFIRKDMIVSFTYEGSFDVEFLISKQGYIELIGNHTGTVNYYYDQFKRYNLSQLDFGNKMFKELNSSIQNGIIPPNCSDLQLAIYAQLLKQNIEVLQGDFRKFSLIYRIFKKIGLT